MMEKTKDLSHIDSLSKKMWEPPELYSLDMDKTMGGLSNGSEESYFNTGGLENVS